MGLGRPPTYLPNDSDGPGEPRGLQALRHGFYRFQLGSDPDHQVAACITLPFHLHPRQPQNQFMRRRMGRRRRRGRGRRRKRRKKGGEEGRRDDGRFNAGLASFRES